MYKLDSGTTSGGTGTWGLGTYEDNAQFLNNLLRSNKARSHAKQHGHFTVKLDRNSGQTYIKFRQYHSEFQPYMSFEQLVKELRLGTVMDDQGLTDSPLDPDDYPELHHYLKTGQIPIQLTVTSSGQQSSQQSDSGKDWTKIEDPDEAWEEFQRQLPDLADMLKGMSEEDRKQVIEMMQKGLSMQEALSLLESRGVGASGNGIPPDGRDKLATADGFKEPHKATRKYIFKHFSRHTADRILSVARKLDVHPKILADVLKEARERGKRIMRAYRKLQARDLDAKRIPTKPFTSLKNRGVKNLKEAVRHWYRAPLTVGTPAQPQRSTSQEITGSPYRDLTYNPKYSKMRHEVEQILREAQDMDILPEEEYRVVLSSDTSALAPEWGGKNAAGMAVMQDRTIIINVEQINQENGPLAHVVIHEAGHLLENEILGRPTRITDEEAQNAIDLAKKLVRLGDQLSEFSRYVEGLKNMMMGTTGEKMKASDMKTLVQNSYSLKMELAAELAACAYTGKPVPEPVYELAKIHLPDAYMKKLGSHITIKSY